MKSCHLIHPQSSRSNRAPYQVRVSPPYHEEQKEQERTPGLWPTVTDSCFPLLFLLLFSLLACMRAPLLSFWMFEWGGIGFGTGLDELR